MSGTADDTERNSGLQVIPDRARIMPPDIRLDDDSPTPLKRATLPSWIVVLAFVLGGAAVSFSRLPVMARNTVWAEDGRIFLQNYVDSGFWDTLFAPYTGYLQFLPRLVTALALQGDLQHYAKIVTIICCLIVGGVAAAVYVFSGSIVQAVWVRILLASITVLAPLTPPEVLGNSANLHWYLLWLAPWLLLYRPKSWVAASVAAAIGLTSSLTEIQVIVFMPLALIAWRDRKALLVRAAVLVGVVAQVISTLLEPRNTALPNPADLHDQIVGYGPLPILGSFNSDALGVGQLVLTLGMGKIVLLCVIVLAVATVSVVLGRGVRRILAIALLASSFVLWSAAGILNWSPRFALFHDEHWATLHETRYAVVPSMLLLAAIVLAAAALAEGGKFSRLASVMVTALVLVALLTNIHNTFSERASGPSWWTVVDNARATCEIDSQEPIYLATAPGQWGALVDCELISK